MKKGALYIFSTLSFLMICFVNSYCQKNDYFKIVLSREIDKKETLIDTIVSFEYLTKTNREGLSNLQDLVEFKYPKLKEIENQNFLSLINDSIQLELKISTFDINLFKKNFLVDKKSFQTNLYYREVSTYKKLPSYYPNFEISYISITINKKKKELARENFSYLYNPSINCSKVQEKQICGINGYITEKGEVIMTILCGEGAGTYIVIFYFDKFGDLKKRIERPLI